jgi:hypothetical protein
MTLHLGNVPANSTLYIPFATYDSNGASVTMSGLAVTDIEIYKNGSVTQRASDAGYALLDTDGIDFDTITGIHGFSIDLSDNTDAGFYAVGSFYWVVTGKPKVDVDAFGGTAGTFASGRPEVNTTHAAGTAWASGAITAAVIADNAIDAGAIAADAITAAKIADGAIDAATFAAGAINAAAIAADAITAAKVAADVSAEIADAVWDEATAGHTTAGTFGEQLKTDVDGIKTKTDSLTFTVANQVDSNIQSVNDITVNGVGTSGNPWGP